MKKFEFNKETGYFCIDPQYLREGLEEAKGKYLEIRVKALDYRSKNLDVDIELLTSQTDLKRLLIDRDIQMSKKEFRLLERLENLEALSIKEIVPLDYSKFRRLKELVLTKGTDLQGLEKVRSLKLLYLSLWNGETLPKSIGSIAATTVRISASRKLTNIEPSCNLQILTTLLLQDLPVLKVGNEINKLTSLEDLYVEKCGWTDFNNLRLGSMRKLLVSKVESLKFIKQLKNLRDLTFWDCVDGDLSPILAHPSLTKLFFGPEKKHYSHKLVELQGALANRNA